MTWSILLLSRLQEVYLIPPLRTFIMFTVNSLSFFLLIVAGFTKDGSTFFKKFGVSMVNMVGFSVLIGAEGENRKIC